MSKTDFIEFYNEGKKDFHNGISSSGCKYPNHTKEFKYWQDGHWDAKEADAKSLEEEEFKEKIFDLIEEWHEKKRLENES